MNPGPGGREVQPFKEYTRTQLSILAMSTINEIMYRHCVPADFESFLLQMFQNTFQLLQMLVQPINTVQHSPSFIISFRRESCCKKKLLLSGYCSEQ